MTYTVHVFFLLVSQYFSSYEMHGAEPWSGTQTGSCCDTVLVYLFFLEGQINEAAGRGLLQEQVEPSGVVHHHTELECRGCFHHEDPDWKPRYDLLPKPQRPVRPSFTVLKLKKTVSSQHHHKCRSCLY